MVKQNLHCHTTFDDGANTPEEMVQAAIKYGLSSLGITLHAPIEGEFWTPPKEKEPEFIEEMHRLKEKYKGTIDIYCGLEYDLYGPKYFEPYEYIVASGHVIDGLYVDNTLERHHLLRDHCGGELGTIERYFSNVSAIAEIPEADIVGHFDLLTKYNEMENLYDINAKAYKDAAYAAMEKLVKADKIFEMNTGAISRGYRKTPYMGADMLQHLKSIGGKLTIQSDGHFSDAVACAFDLCEDIAKSCGFEEIWYFDGEKFYPEKF